MGNRSDSEWEKWGQENPYFGVLTNERFLGTSLSDADRQEFFESGAQHVAELLKIVDSLGGYELADASVLDFGCGVGRLTAGFAPHAAEVVGIDVSPSMLATARRDLPEEFAGKVHFRDSIEELESPAKYDLVHTYIVMQHIPVDGGMEITRKLLGKLKPGGVVALQYTFSSSQSRAKRLANSLSFRFPPAKWAANLAQRKPWNAPLMEMNEYDLEAILLLLQEHGIGQVHLVQTTHGLFHGAFLIGIQAEPSPPVF
jgi:trans-aconitate methyltransferase